MKEPFAEILIGWMTTWHTWSIIRKTFLSIIPSSHPLLLQKIHISLCSASQAQRISRIESTPVSVFLTAPSVLFWCFVLCQSSALSVVSTSCIQLSVHKCDWQKLIRNPLQVIYLHTELGKFMSMVPISKASCRMSLNHVLMTGAPIFAPGLYIIKWTPFLSLRKALSLESAEGGMEHLEILDMVYIYIQVRSLAS